MIQRKHSLDFAGDPITQRAFMLSAIGSEVDALSRISQTNRSLQEAGRIHWGDNPAGRAVADRLLKQFGLTAAALESLGWPADWIRDVLAPSRQVLATSAFVERCQRWTRGYAGDFETIEHLVAGANQSVPGTLGWHFEHILLESPIVRQHRNKLMHQSIVIENAISRNKAARVLSIGCGGGLDFLPVRHCLSNFEGEIVLNDREPAALEAAAQRLRPVTGRFRLQPGNVLNVVRQLSHGARFDLVVAGGLFDYLPDRAIVLLLRLIVQNLLHAGGVLLFTNIAEGNPARALMEYAANWFLLERSESVIVELAREAGIPDSYIRIAREATGLTLICKLCGPKNVG